MKRKIIQIADSTQLVSLPRKWALKYGIKKGDEVEVEEQDSKILISTEKGHVTQKVELDIDNLDPMVLRYVVALYKKGVDEIDITFDKPAKIRIVQEAIGKEAVGYEITDQRQNSCTIKHVSGELEEFDPILKRTFLLLVSMADQTYNALKEGNLEELKNAAYMEEANNRFTTTCRRLLNKKGDNKNRKIGPMYYIIEELEKIADQYKYLCMYFYEKKEVNVKFSKEALGLLEKANDMLKEFSDLFYKYKVEEVVRMGKLRKEIVNKTFDSFEKSKNINDTVLLHYVLTIMQKTFCLIGPYLVIEL
jgi:phosphate uptake regulator